jgi:hypothetical protein
VVQAQEALRDSEIEQLWFTVTFHEHVSRLDIPVNDVVSVCEIYCRANLEKKFEAFS